MYVIKTDKGYIKGTARGGYSFVIRPEARRFDRIELLAKFVHIEADLKEHYSCELVESVSYFCEEVEV